MTKQESIPSLREEIIAGCESGEFLAQLKEHCRGWKRHRTPFAVGNVVRHDAEDDRADELYEVLLDADFRELRQAQFSLNELRADLQIGRDFFSHKRPDLLRYMQIVFLEQGAVEDPNSLRLHERHCKSFADFLQLDRLPSERVNMGLHRALGRFFRSAPILTRG